MTTSLLPSNTTDFERAVEAAVSLDVRLPALAGLRRAKLDAIVPFVPWLIWEYGLGEVLPYLDDPQRAIREGVLWQRIRGTPAGLRVAYSWRGLDNAIVEERGPGANFAGFMVDPGAVPADAQTILDLIALARLAAPARSRLTRVFHGYDLRNFRLDKSRLSGALLSSFSGVPGPDGVLLSFGRKHHGAVAVEVAGVDAAVAPLRVAEAKYLLGFALDRSRLSKDKPLVWPEFTQSHLFVVEAPEGLAVPDGMLPTRHFIKGQVVPSSGPNRFGGVNHRTAGRVMVQDGHPLLLSGGGSRLSAGARRIRYQPVLEWHRRVTPASTDAPEYIGFAGDPTRTAEHTGATVEPPAGATFVVSYGTARAGGAAFRGQFWTGARWPAQRWSDVREIIGSTHTPIP